METKTQTETLVAARNGDHFEFTGRVSKLFDYAMGEKWREHFYAPYYREFWEPLHKELEKTRGLLEIDLDAEYTLGVVSEDEMRSFLELWRASNLPEMVMVDRPEGKEGTVSFVRLKVLGYDIRTVEDE